MAKDNWMHLEPEGTWLDPGNEDDENRGIKSMMLEILMRAYFDSVGLLGGMQASSAGRRKIMHEAAHFLHDKTECDYGTATDICIIATGTDNFIKYLRKAYKKNNPNKENIYD